MGVSEGIMTGVSDGTGVLVGAGVELGAAVSVGTDVEVAVSEMEVGVLVVEVLTVEVGVDVSVAALPETTI